MPCSGSSTSPMPVMISECSRSATASIASSRRRIRSVRQSLSRRLTFFAPPLTTTLPRVTWPSPPSATLAPRRTERMVVPWKDSMRERTYLGNETGIFKTTCKARAIQSGTLSAERSPARKGGAEIDLHLGAEPAGVGPLAGADAVVQPVERERTGHHRLAAALAQPERDVHVAALSLDVERAARELTIVAHLHGFAGEGDERMAGDVEEFLCLERCVDLG